MKSFCLSMALACLGVAVILTADRVPGRSEPSRGDAVPASETTARTFRSAVDLVTLNVTVTDVRNRYVAGLAQDDFLVLEDGVRQPLTFFAAKEVPLDVTLLLDTSSSMRDKMPVVRKAAEGFIRCLGPSDRASVVGFTTRTVVLQATTNDQTALVNAVNRTRADGNTALYVALYVALDEITRAGQPTAEVRRHAIIVLTDGEDTASSIRFDDLLDRARRAGIAIYPIAIVDEYVAQPGMLNDNRRFVFGAEQQLNSLARETGARAFHPAQLTDLNGVYRSVAEELSMQYALGYLAKPGPADGGFRHLLVRMPAHPELKSRTRTGYYAAGPERAANVR